MTRSIAIVGASLAGARAAQSLRRHGFDGTISLVGAEQHAPYDRPPLSKGVLTGATDDPRLESDEHWAEQQVHLELGQRVVAIHRDVRTIELASGEALPADAVLLCTGGRARRLDVPGSDLPGVWCLRTLEDSRAVREGLVAGARVVVVGAGFIGAEVAASAREVGCEVSLVEVAEVPLWRVLGQEMGRFYAQVHRSHGVRVLTGVGVVEIIGDARVRSVLLSDGTALPADLVVVGVGIEPSTELAEQAGAAVGNGILVDEYCQTSVPGVFAAGDVANFPHPLLGERVRLEHWQNAQNQAAAAAASMLGRGAPFCEVPWFWSDQYDLNLQVAGHPHASDQTVHRGRPDDGAFSVFYLRDGAVRAVLGVNRPRDVRAGIDLIRRSVAVREDAIADESTDLRTLARSALT